MERNNIIIFVFGRYRGYGRYGNLTIKIFLFVYSIRFILSIRPIYFIHPIYFTTLAILLDFIRFILSYSFYLIPSI